MYFYQILHACDETVLTEEFLKLCKDSPDLQRTETVFTEFLKNIKALAPEYSDEWTLFMTREQDVHNSEYYHVYARNSPDSENFGIMITPWKEVLGWTADSGTLASFPAEVFAAAVLWELTWLGYDEETIQKKAESWNEDQNR